MATLWVFDGIVQQEYELGDEPVTIGRAAGNSIRLDDRRVSKFHARIEKDAIGWKVIDLESSNGTYLDGKEIESAHLVSGVRLRIGKTEFVLDDTTVASDSVDEFNELGTIMTSIPAIPQGLLNNLLEEPPTLAGGKLTGSTPSGGRAKITPKERIEERKLRLIGQMGEAMIDLTETPAVAQEILRLVVAETQADRGFLCRFRDDGSYFPLASLGLNAKDSVHFSRTVLNKMQQEQSGVLIRQVSAGELSISSLKTMHVYSTMCVPLWTRNRIIGFLSLDMTQSHRSFTTTHLDLLVAVAHQAALGLERARFAEAVEAERKRRDYLCQYLDHKIIQSMLDNPTEQDPLAPREQVITVLFCDIVSFTKMCERMPPAELAAFIRDHLTAMTEIVFAHDGTIDKYIGDAVMALFGAPVEDPNAAKNAVAAAMEMQALVEEQEGRPVQLRSGIATGPVIVGNIGSVQRVEYTALGDTVNVASRLEGMARPGEVVIDGATRAKLGPEIAVEALGTTEVKNRVEQVNVFRVLRTPGQ